MRRWYAAIAVLPVLFWGASVALAAWRPDLLIAIAVEDGPLEQLQTVSLLAAVGVAAAICLRLRRGGQTQWAALYAVATLVLFWLMGEEISWGQRIFGWGTPEVLAENLQGESNLHNLPGVTKVLHYTVLALIPVFAVASLALWRGGADRVRRWKLPLWMPHPVLIPAWLCFWSYTPLRMLDMWYFGLAGPRPVMSKLQEAAEVVLYAGVLAFLVMAFTSVATERASAPHDAASVPPRPRGPAHSVR